MQSNTQLGPIPDHSIRATNFPVREAIGALMYLAICTRPDIAYAVFTIARYQAKPDHRHEQAIKTIFRYLKLTKNLALTYSNESQEHMYGAGFGSISKDEMDSTPVFAASDANYARGDRSRSGYALFRAGAAFSWKCAIQPRPVLSTTESEYVAACLATQKILWARELLDELGLRQHRPTKLQMDNQIAIHIAQGTANCDRTSHIANKEMFVKYYVLEDPQVAPEWVPTEDNPADIFTKPLASGTKNEDSAFMRHRDTILGLARDINQFHKSHKLH